MCGGVRCGAGGLIGEGGGNVGGGGYVGVWGSGVWGVAVWGVAVWGVGWRCGGWRGVGGGRRTRVWGIPNTTPSVTTTRIILC